MTSPVVRAVRARAAQKANSIWYGLLSVERTNGRPSRRARWEDLLAVADAGQRFGAGLPDVGGRLGGDDGAEALHPLDRGRADDSEVFEDELAIGHGN